MSTQIHHGLVCRQIMDLSLQISAKYNGQIVGSKIESASYTVYPTSKFITDDDC